MRQPTATDALAVRAHRLLKADAANMKDSDFGRYDVKRALTRAFEKGVPDEKLCVLLVEAKSARDAIRMINRGIEGINCDAEIEKWLGKTHRKGVRAGRSFFTPREADALRSLGVPEENIEMGELSEEDKKRIQDAIEALDIRQNHLKVVRARFGLDGEEAGTFDELAAKFSVKETAVRYIIAAAMMKISPGTHSTE